MNTLQHSLCYLLTKSGNIDEFRKGIAYCLLPDALRAYTGPRAYTHFEENCDQDDVSWYKFPTDIKNLTKEIANEQEKHLAINSKKSCLGETSHVDKFIETNSHLDKDCFDGVLTHLIQDYIFDEWIREKIDCSGRYEPNEEYDFKNIRLDGNLIRLVIAGMEEYGFYYLTYLVYQLYGIVANEEWFYENVYKVLLEKYPEDLANKTYSYMKIPYYLEPSINKHNWTGIDLSEYVPDYDDLYKKVVASSIDTDYFFNEVYKKPDNTNESHKKM